MKSVSVLSGPFGGVTRVVMDVFPHQATFSDTHGRNNELNFPISNTTDGTEVRP